MEDLNLVKIIYFSASLITIIFFFLFLKRIQKYIGIYDKPENFRKVHKSIIPPIGGVIFYVIFTIYFLFILITDFQSQFFIYKKQIIAIIICSTFIFIFGLIDDKYNLGSLIKSLCFIFFITVFVLNDIKSEIYYLKFETFDKILALNRFSLFFTIFSIFAFMNALNMYDGINLQSGLYLIFLCIIFLFKSLDPLFFLINIICLIIFSFYNYKNKIFMGNNGIYFLSFIFGIFFIKSNNYLSIISTEEILILMAIPGIDMLRLFFIRIINGKSPFLGDNKHIHHLLLNKFKEKTVLVVFSLTLFPYIFFSLFGLAFAVFLFQIFSYFFIIKLSKNR